MKGVRACLKSLTSVEILGGATAPRLRSEAYPRFSYNMSSTAPKLLACRGNALGAAHTASIGRLIALAFPTPGVTEHDRVRDYSAGVGASAEHDVFLVIDGDRVLAHAMIFPREIATSAGRLRVGALAAVCSDPEHRGRGYGREVVRAAFARATAGAYPVSLFQTGVPDFYAKLGARLVDNRFINSLWKPPGEGERPTNGTRDSPWWNPYIMIYPATYAWPEGEIDLLGPGF